MKYRFQTFELDCNCRELNDNGKPLPLPPKAFALLMHLIENRERMVSKRELLELYWPANETDAALLKSVSLIRKVFHNGGTSNAIVKTYHGQGYRFIAEIETAQPLPPSEESTPIVLSEQRLASVVCVRFQEVDADLTIKADIVDKLEHYLAQARSIVDHHQGQLLHMMIDGFTAAFGAHRLYEDVARRALHCAVALADQTAMDASNSSAFTLTIGIDTGPIALDETEQDWRLPNVIERQATQLAQHAGNGEILLTQKTFNQLHDEIETEETPYGYKLISPPAQRAGIPARPHKRPSKFVGRRAEIAFLSANLNATLAGQGNAEMLSGPAGIGKTRLVSEFLNHQLPADCRSTMLHCLPSLNNTPLSPIRALCKALLAFAPVPTTNDLDQALLRELLDESQESEPVLKGLSDHEHRQKSYQLLDRLLASACADLPLIIVVEDVHWIDTTSLEYLNNMVANVENKRLMLMMTTRPVETRPLVDAVINLSPLSRNDCRELLRTSPSKNFQSHTADLLIKRAAGNPFFLEELAFAAQAGIDPNAEPPETVQAVIAVRIGSLPPIQRTLLYITSVIGPPAPKKLIAHLCKQTVDDIYPRLVELMKSGFIIEEAECITFRHMLISDTAYSMIAKADRRKLHSQIAHYYEDKPNDEPVRSEILAWHHQEAGETEAAIVYWIAACRTALSRSTRHETVAFAKNGLALINSNSDQCKRQMLDLQLMLASALTTLQGFADPEAGEAYLKAQALNRDVGNPKTIIRVLVGLWIHSWVRGNLDESLSYAHELMALAKVAKQPALYLQAHASMGQVLMHLGQIEAALEHLQTGLEFIKHEPPRTLPKQNAAVSCACYAAWSAHSDLARQFYETSQRLTQVLKNPFALAIHYSLSAEYLMFEGDIDECLLIADQAVSTSREHHFNFWLGTGLMMRGWALGQRDEFEQAFEAIDEGITVFESTGAGVQLANWYGLKAETQLAAGNWKAGLASVETALGHADLTEDLYFAPRIHTIAAKLHDHLGNKRDSVLHAKQGQKLAERFKLAPNATRLYTL